MPRPKVKREARDKGVSALMTEKSDSKKLRRLVAIRSIDKMKAKGFKLVKQDVLDGRGKVLGVQVHAQDLVLMEK